MPHTKTRPLAKLLSIRHLDQWDLVLRAQRHHELLVGLLLACLVQHAHVRLSSIEGLAGFAETTCETVVDESDLEDTLQSVEDGHLALAGRGICADLDLVGRGDLRLSLFSVRLFVLKLVLNDRWRAQWRVESHHDDFLRQYRLILEEFVDVK